LSPTASRPCGFRHASRRRGRKKNLREEIPQGLDAPEAHKTRSIRAKAAGTNPKYIDLADKRDWLSRIDKDAKEARNQRIFNLWLACWSLEEIAEREGLTKQAVDLIRQETAELPKLDKPSRASADHATDFDPPLYNVWKQQEKTKGSNHFGNTEVRWLDNLLYLYTQPFDVVIDPFAGGGTGEKMVRRGSEETTQNQHWRSETPAYGTSSTGGKGYVSRRGGCGLRRLRQDRRPRYEGAGEGHHLNRYTPARHPCLWGQKGLSEV
jgi:hypothetical protein